MDALELEQQIEQFLTGTMSRDARKAFLKRMQEDPSLKARVKIRKNMRRQNRDEDIFDLQHSLEKIRQTRDAQRPIILGPKRVWWLIGAGTALLGLLGAWQAYG